MAAQSLMTDYPWLNPENLVAFLDELREAGFRVGVPDYVKVHDLAVRLLATGVTLDQPQQLGRYLGPLLCSSEAEQMEFEQRFAHWMRRLNAPVRQTPPGGKPGLLEEELEEISQRGRTVRLLAILVVLCLTIAILAFLILANQPSISVPELPLGPSLPRRSSTNLVTAFILGLLGLSSLSTFWLLFVRWRAHQYLERQTTGEQPKLVTISVVHDTEALFPSIIFFRLAERMRRRVRVASSEVDIKATLHTTLEQGGWVVPVRGTRLQVPEYLVLIDRTSFRDHQSRLIEEMIARLREHEVFVSIYYFDGDPRACYEEETHQRGEPLEILAQKHGDKRLLLFADPKRLYHPLKNDLAAWTDVFVAWPERVLLTTTPREHWGLYEAQLQPLITVLPTTADSLTNFVMGDLLENSQGSQLTGAPLPTLLLERPYRWLNRDKPDDTLIEQVLLALRTYLDRAGFFWLCACAIFPKLQWDITLYLGQALKTDTGIPLWSYDRLVTLARLPWFRHGYMPDWFRLYLISTLTPAQEGIVRRTLQALLLSAVEGTVGYHQLEVAHVHPRALDFLARPIIRLLARNAPDNSPLSDYIFVSYMAHSKQLAIQLPVRLRDRLLSGSRRSLDWAIWREWTMAHTVGGTPVWLAVLFLLEFCAPYIWPLLMVTMSYGLARLQVWAGRKRLESDRRALWRSFSGMMCSHLAIYSLSSLIHAKWWSFDSSSLEWAAFGGMIGVSDSLGRYLYWGKHNADQSTRIRPYSSIVGFAVGFLLFGWWCDIFSRAQVEIQALGLFFVWLCYGMATGVPLVWGSPRAISAPDFWLRIRAWQQEQMALIQQVPMRARNRFISEWLLANVIVTIITSSISFLMVTVFGFPFGKIIVNIVMSGAFHGYVQTIVLRRHTSWSAGWLFAIFWGMVLWTAWELLPFRVLIFAPIPQLLKAIPAQFFLHRRFNDRGGWLVANLIVIIIRIPIISLMSSFALGWFSFIYLSCLSLVNSTITGFYLLRYLDKSVTASENQQFPLLLSLRYKLHLPWAKWFIILWSVAYSLGLHSHWASVFYFDPPKTATPFLAVTVATIIETIGLGFPQFLVMLLILKHEKLNFTFQWCLASGIGGALGAAISWALIYVYDISFTLGVSIIGVILGLTTSILQWHIGFRRIKPVIVHAVYNTSFLRRSPGAKWILYNVITISVGHLIIAGRGSIDLDYLGVLVFDILTVQVIISSLFLYYLPEDWFRPSEPTPSTQRSESSSSI
jgi:hypothetical protein